MLAAKGLLPMWNRGRVAILDIKGDDPELQIGQPVKAFPSRLEQMDRDSQGRRWWRIKLNLADRPAARRIAYQAFAKAFNARHWTVYVDELVVMSEPMDDKHLGLGLQGTIDHHYLLGRYRPVTLIAATQQPSKIPTSAKDQATHLYVGPLGDDYRNARGGEILGDRHLREELRRLKRFEWIYIYRPTGEMEIVRYGA